MVSLELPRLLIKRVSLIPLNEMPMRKSNVDAILNDANRHRPRRGIAGGSGFVQAQKNIKSQGSREHYIDDQTYRDMVVPRLLQRG